MSESPVPSDVTHHRRDDDEIAKPGKRCWSCMDKLMNGYHQHGRQSKQRRYHQAPERYGKAAETARQAPAGDIAEGDRYAGGEHDEIAIDGYAWFLEAA